MPLPVDVKVLIVQDVAAADEIEMTALNDGNKGGENVISKRLKLNHRSSVTALRV
jgi:hypothetical protein